MKYLGESLTMYRMAALHMAGSLCYTLCSPHAKMVSGDAHLLSGNPAWLQCIHTPHFCCDITECMQTFYDIILHINGPRV